MTVGTIPLKRRPRMIEWREPPGGKSRHIGQVPRVSVVDTNRHAYLGIDPSLGGHTLAVVTSSGDHYSRRFSSDSRWPLGCRWEDLKRHVQWFVEDVLLVGYQVQASCVETPAFKAEFGREISGGVAAATQMGLIAALGVQAKAAYPYAVAPTSLKLFVTGSGKGDKDQISKGVYKKWGIDAPQNDIADAIALAFVAQALYVDSPDQLAYEKRALTTIRAKGTEWPKAQGRSSMS